MVLRHTALVAVQTSLVPAAAAHATPALGDPLRATQLATGSFGNHRWGPPALVQDTAAGRTIALVPHSTHTNTDTPANGEDLHAFVLDAAGAPTGVTAVLDDLPAFKRATLPAGAADPGGGKALIAWSSTRGHVSNQHWEIWTRVVDTTTLAAPAPATQLSVTGPSNEGRFAGGVSVVHNPVRQEYGVFWYANRVDGQGGAWEVLGQRVDEAGAPVGPVVTVSTTSAQTHGLYEPSVAVDPTTGAYLVASWGTSADTAVEENEIHVRRLSALLEPLGPQRRLTSVGPQADPQYGAYNPALAFDPRSRTHLLAYAENLQPLSGGADAIEYEIGAQRLDADGTPIGAPLRVSAAGPAGDGRFDAYEPSVTANPDGREWLVTWKSDSNQGGRLDNIFELTGERVGTDGTRRGADDVPLIPWGTTSPSSVFATDFGATLRDPAAVTWDPVGRGFVAAVIGAPPTGLGADTTPSDRELFTVRVGSGGFVADDPDPGTGPTPGPVATPVPGPGSGGGGTAGGGSTGDGSGGAGGLGGAPTADRTAPVVRALRLTARTFRLGTRRTAQRAAARRGTTISFSLSEPAVATLAIERTTRRGGRLRRTRVVTLTRTIRRAGVARVAFSGRVGKRRLTPGSYRVTVVARDAAGNRSAARRAAFRVVRR